MENTEDCEIQDLLHFVADFWNINNVKTKKWSWYNNKEERDKPKMDNIDSMQMNVSQASLKQNLNCLVKDLNMQKCLLFLRTESLVNQN